VVWAGELDVLCVLGDVRGPAVHARVPEVPGSHPPHFGRNGSGNSHILNIKLLCISFQMSKKLDLHRFEIGYDIRMQWLTISPSQGLRISPQKFDKIPQTDSVFHTRYNVLVKLSSTMTVQSTPCETKIRFMSFTVENWLCVRSTSLSGPEPGTKKPNPVATHTVLYKTSHNCFKKTIFNEGLDILINIVIN
jgi:hypothetical protein